MHQVELPPCHGPRSPLDVVAIKIIFGRIFESFQQISQVATIGTTSADDNKPLKRLRRPPLKKVLLPRYSCILLFIL
jgi:hypothetical protein